MLTTSYVAVALDLISHFSELWGMISTSQKELKENILNTNKSKEKSKLKIERNQVLEKRENR